jgi:glycosyltransferase involved in cell wall biosynthesis
MFIKAQQMKIALYPYKDGNNPFIRLLRAALENQGISIVETDQCNPIWLWQHRSAVHALHFHWIQPLYYKKTFLGTVFGLLRFSINLLSARTLKYRIVWTVHNLFPHQSKYERLDCWARKMMVFFSSVIVVHCDYARQLVKRTFRVKKDIMVIPHGHYADYHKSVLDKKTARNLFDLSPSAFIFVMIGRIEPYKGVDNLIRHFKAVRQDDIMLVIAGQPSDSGFADHISKEAGNDRRIITILRRLDDEELANLVTASDVVVAPFTDILTSGTVVAALSLGRPVITPRIGCLKETVEEGMGLLYGSVNTDLRESLTKARQTTFSRPEDIISRVKSHMNWTQIGKSYHRIYHPEL